MKPSLRGGDFVVGNRIPVLLRRLTTGKVYVLDFPLKNNYLAIKRLHREENGKYYFIGDNLQNSIDSRHFGALHISSVKAEIIGKVRGFRIERI